MKRARLAIAAIATTGFAVVAYATPLQTPLALDDCIRVVRGWNGWEVGHRDLGAGRVAFAETWSAEGVYTDIYVSDCETGESLRTRTRQELMSEAPPFDRTRRAVEVVDRHARRHPALFGIDMLAEELSGIGEGTTTFVTPDELCACAAFYPELRGDRTPFAFR
ncbi:MAG: hypothetical protein AAFR47_18185 [Pseudomonadota bacterium]